MIDEAKILKGLRLACAKGWRVHTRMDDADYDRKCGCALTVAAVGLGYKVDGYVGAAHKLGLTVDEENDFVDSFDGRLGTGTRPIPFAIALRSGCFDGRSGFRVIP